MKITQKGVFWKTIHYYHHALYVDELPHAVGAQWETGYGRRNAPHTLDPSMHRSSNCRPLVRERIITPNSVKRRIKE